MKNTLTMFAIVLTLCLVAACSAPSKKKEETAQPAPAPVALDAAKAGRRDASDDKYAEAKFHEALQCYWTVFRENIDTPQTTREVYDKMQEVADKPPCRVYLEQAWAKQCEYPGTSHELRCQKDPEVHKQALQDAVTLMTGKFLKTADEFCEKNRTPYRPSYGK